IFSLLVTRAQLFTLFPYTTLFRSVIDAELCFITGTGAPNFASLQLALRSRQHHKLAVFAFDFLHRDGIDLRPLPLYQRKLRLARSEEHTSELQSQSNLVCRLLLEK